MVRANALVQCSSSWYLYMLWVSLCVATAHTSYLLPLPIPLPPQKLSSELEKRPLPSWEVCVCGRGEMGAAGLGVAVKCWWGWGWRWGQDARTPCFVQCCSRIVWSGSVKSSHPSLVENCHLAPLPATPPAPFRLLLPDPPSLLHSPPLSLPEGEGVGEVGGLFLERFRK